MAATSFHSPGALSGVFPPRKSSLRTSGEDVCLSDRLMYPGAQNGLREPLCCECHVHFGGRLPVPRAEAALPYWVPSSLRPREQSQRTVRFHVPKASESCPCLCHCVRGRLPVPRSQAMMPYWVPQVLRSPKKTVKRQRSFRGLQGASLNGCPYFSSLLRGFRLCSCVISQLRLLHEPAPLPGPTCLASGSGTLTGTGLTCKWRNVSAGQNAEPDVARKKPSPGEVGWTPAQSLLSGTWVTPTVPRLNGKTRDSLFM
ncbi:uncharacterized protein C16orf95 homolog isoform X14 [Oryctolagus cuniculus]|uniref:uncharacterized protein C16orf95 homolog isoform X14 n=1 Tax=Oryctolagus cuniculus TaxID=9986 RepID=UPI00387A30AC